MTDGQGPREALLAAALDALRNLSVESLLASIGVREIARRDEVPMEVLGEVRGRSIIVGDLVEVALDTARERWRRALERRLGG